MEAEEILSQVKAGDAPPAGWVVFPLLKNKVLWGIVGWICGIIMGLILLVLVVPIVVPFNYTHSVLVAVFTTLLLGILLFVTFGSVYLLVMDIFRLLNHEKHLIVVTEEDFIKCEGAKIIQVPLAHVKYVTPRGRPPLDRTPPGQSKDENGEEDDSQRIPNMGEYLLGFVFGRGTTSAGMRQRRKRMRTPASLAFLDDRTNTEVTVVSDASFGDPFMIAAVLKQSAAAVQTEAVQEGKK